MSPARANASAGERFTAPVGREARDVTGKPTGCDRLAQLGHQRQVIVQVVDRREPRAEDFVDPQFSYFASSF